MSDMEIKHVSDCAVHNGPAYEPGPCDCGAARDHLFDEMVKALKYIAELQNAKCQTASAEILYALLDLKVAAARAVLSKVKEAGHG